MTTITFILTVPDETVESHQTMYISGSFNSWGQYEMTFNSSDITHSITVALSPGSHEYKFTDVAWGSADTFDPLLSTGQSLHTITLYDIWTNRLLIVTGAETALTIYAELNNPQSQLVPFDNICFGKGTLITSDQGDIAIEKLDPSINTINNKKIIAITKSMSTEKHLVYIKQDALGNNIPNRDTITTCCHCILYKDKMERAVLISHKCDDVELIDYDNRILYNILMENHEKISANNMIAETLHPLNKIAKMYSELQN